MDYYEMANMVSDFSEEEKKKYDTVLELDKDIYGIWKKDKYGQNVYKEVPLKLEDRIFQSEDFNKL